MSQSHSIYDLILRYLKVFLSWPPIILVITILFLKKFHEPISDFLKRMVIGEGYGIRLEATKPIQDQETINSAPQTIEKILESDQTEEIKDESISSIGQNNTEVFEDDPIERYIRENPKQVKEEFQKVLNFLHFEKTYNIIFGTQIQALDYLATKGIDGEYYINLSFYYNEHIKKFKSTPLQISDFFGFIKNSQLIESEGEGNSLKFKITTMGLGFLSYIKTTYPSNWEYKAY